MYWPVNTWQVTIIRKKELFVSPRSCIWFWGQSASPRWKELLRCISENSGSSCWSTIVLRRPANLGICMRCLYFFGQSLCIKHFDWCVLSTLISKNLSNSKFSCFPLLEFHSLVLAPPWFHFSFQRDVTVFLLLRTLSPCKISSFLILKTGFNWCVLDCSQILSWVDGRGSERCVCD